MNKKLELSIDIILGILISAIIISITILGYNSYSSIQNFSNSIKKPSYSQLYNMTVRIEHHDNNLLGYGWIGTGVVVKITDDFTYILTNKHVAPTGVDVIIIENNITYDAKVLKNDEDFDLSLIKVIGKIPEKEAIKTIDRISIADKIYSVGMYRGLDYIYTEGTASGHYFDEGLEHKIMNMPCTSGCSGSGVFDKDGDLVGLVFAVFISSGDSLDTTKSICVPSYAIKDFLKDIL